MFKRFVFFLIFFIPALVTAETDMTDEAMRYQTLTRELRCLVCQNESLADSNAPLAKDLQRQIQTRIAQGQSDEQIIHYLTDRYGEFILFKPSLSSKNFILWAGPFIFLLLGFAILGMIIHIHHKKDSKQ